MSFSSNTVTDSSAVADKGGKPESSTVRIRLYLSSLSKSSSDASVMTPVDELIAKISPPLRIENARFALDPTSESVAVT